MPFAVRRQSDGKWYRRTGASNRQMVDEIDKATTWASKGPAKASLAQAINTVGEGEVLEIIELQFSVLRTVETATVTKRAGHTWKCDVNCEKPKRRGFRDAG